LLPYTTLFRSSRSVRPDPNRPRPKNPDPSADGWSPLERTRGLQSCRAASVLGEGTEHRGPLPDRRVLDDADRGIGITREQPLDLSPVSSLHEQQTARLRLIVQWTRGEDGPGFVHLRLPLTMRRAMLHARIGVGTIGVSDGEDRHM